MRGKETNNFTTRKKTREKDEIKGEMEGKRVRQSGG